MNEDFYRRVLDHLLHFQDRQLSEQAMQFTQQLTQGQTVSEVLHQIPSSVPRKAELRAFLYLVQLAGIVEVVRKVDGINQAQADDVISYLYEISGADKSPPETQ